MAIARPADPLSPSSRLIRLCQRHRHAPGQRKPELVGQVLSAQIVHRRLNNPNKKDSHYRLKSMCELAQLTTQLTSGTQDHQRAKGIQFARWNCLPNMQRPREYLWRKYETPR